MARCRAVVAAVVGVAMALVSVGADVRIAAAEDAVEYRPPVDAPVVDPFRPPANPYGVGNRGLTYEPVPGTSVVAAADGDVVFAGSVGGTRHVTVLHADGLRTSYSFLSTVGVARGARVSAGDPLGTAGSGFHFGVRAGDAYLDPAALFGAVEIRVRLVPHDEVLPPTDAGLLREREVVAEVVRRRSLLDAARDRLAAGASRVVETVRNGVVIVRRLPPATIVTRSATQILDRWRQPCTSAEMMPIASGVDARSPSSEVAASADVADPIPRPATALLVAGYGSEASDAAIDDVDTATLGYADDAVLRFSYRGGRVPTGDGGQLSSSLAAIEANDYDPHDTFGDLVEAGGRLADLIEAAAAARPGVPVDVFAHSQGGIVTRVALSELARRPGGIDSLGVVVTIGTPHHGADLATVAQVLPIRTHEALDQTIGRVVDVDSRSVAVRQLASGSDLIRRLADEGIPDGVDFRTIGARGDLVVTGDKTLVEGHPGAIVDLVGPSAHAGLPGATATTQELRLALAGAAPACDSFMGVVLDAVVPQATSWTETTAGSMFAAA